MPLSLTKQSIGWLDYMLMYLLLGISSMHFLLSDFYLVLGFIVSGGLLILRRAKIDLAIIGYILAFSTLMLAQVLIQGRFDFGVAVALVIRIIFAYAVVKLLGEKIGVVFIRMMSFFTWTSLVVWAIIVILPSTYDVIMSLARVIYPLNLYKAYYHVFVFTMNVGDGIIARNPGPFWEPGGFGVFLNLALLFNLLTIKSLRDTKSLLFIAGILTTQSTGAYFSLLTVLLFYTLVIKRSLATAIIVPVLILVSLYAYNELPFLKQKVSHRIEKVNLSDTRFEPRTRLVSALEDWKDIKRYPLFGKGRFIRSEESEQSGFQLSRRPNGTVNFIAVFGILGSIIYFGFMFKSFHVYSKEHGYGRLAAFGMLLIVLIMGMSQSLFFKPFFIALSFFFLFRPKTHHPVRVVS